jgi:hypothetical protein
MAGTPMLWHVPDTEEYEKSGETIELVFNVIEEVGTILELVTDGTSMFILAGAGFALGGIGVAAGGMFGEFWSIGKGYAEALSLIAKEQVATGFARGVVVAVHGRTAKALVSLFGHDVYHNTNFQEAEATGTNAYREGLKAGYIDGYKLKPQQKKNLWTDLESRAGERWGRREYEDEYAAARFYAGLAGTFRRYHLR